MLVLVTGGSGFIGSHVVDKLNAYGVTPRIFDQLHSPYRDDVEHQIGSLLDLEKLRMAMTAVDVVIHLAAVADVKEVLLDPVYAENVNAHGTLNVLEAARRSGVRRVIYGSTTWVYSDCAEDTVDEETLIPPPRHLYTATKLAGESYCRAYGELYDVEYTILRFGIPYGPRARDTAVIPVFVNKALKGEPLTVAGEGLQYRNFVYVEDLAEGSVLALKPNAKNRVYNLDGSEQISVLRIAQTVRDVLGEVRIVHTETRPGDFSGKKVKSERARNELGWEAGTSFEEGVRRYVEWYKEREVKRVESLDKVSPVLLDPQPRRKAPE